MMADARETIFSGGAVDVVARAQRRRAPRPRVLSEAEEAGVAAIPPG